MNGSRIILLGICPRRRTSFAYKHSKPLRHCQSISIPWAQKQREGNKRRHRADPRMSRVCCVTGASGYIGSWLVKKLLDRGCDVHATVRDLGDEMKVGLLRSFPGAAERLRLFQADFDDAAAFEQAIAGSEFVFLVAAPMVRHGSDGRSKHAIKSVVNATRTILEQCERSKTVRRVIYTGSSVAASPLKEDGSGYSDFVDESCWTPLGLSYGYSNEGLAGYVSGKTRAEKVVLGHTGGGGASQSRAFDVVTLLCGLVGGDTILPFLNSSLQAMVSPLTGAEPPLNSLKFIQALLGAVPLVHVDDVCEAHVFCMDLPSVAGGRFLCAAAWPNMRDIVDHHARKHNLNPAVKELPGEGVRVQAGTSKLVDLGFRFRYGAEEVLDATVECAKRLGLL